MTHASLQALPQVSGRHTLGALFLPALIALLSIAMTPAAANLPDFADLVEDNVSSVVHITVVSEGEGMLDGLRRAIPEEWFDRRIFPWPEEEPRLRQGQGSGFIISTDGYVLTNNHVVASGGDITVRMHDRREFKAELVGADARSDVALLKVDADDLPAAKLGQSDNLRVGEWVFAIGSPFNFEYSVTAGIVSALGRSSLGSGASSFVPFIQSDVAINPGNSGGPLFDLEGRVIGINSQIFSRSGGFQGISLSIPIDAAMEVVEMLKADGTVSRGFLGVRLDSGPSFDVAKSLGLDRPMGALVTEVLEDTPAEEAGLASGDVILSVDGEDVDLSSDLPFMIGRRKSGDVVNLKVWRDRSELDVEVTLALLPDDEDDSEATPEDGDELKPGALGLGVSEVPQELATRLDVEGGVLVRSSTGLARAADIQSGDIILKVQGAAITSLAEFSSAVENLAPGDHASFLILRGNFRTYRAIRVPD